MNKIYVALLSLLVFTGSAQAADFQWMDEQGDIHALSQAYQGQAVVVHFWASWCPPCVAEMPEMAEWLKAHPQVKVLPVSLDNDLETAHAFLQQNHIALPALLTDNAQSARMGVRGLPTTILIDPRGEVVTSRIGMQDWQQASWTNQILAMFSTQNAATQ